MTIGNIKAAAMQIRTIREDWDLRQVTDQVNTLAADYTHRDVVYACVTVAEDLNNRSPVTLSIKAADIITKLHEKTRTPRTFSAGRRDDAFLCDTCSKTEANCMSAATNLDGSDHLFKSIRQAEAEREKQRAANSPTRVEAKAEVARHRGDLFAMPADIDQHDHPEPEQESA